MRVGDGIIYPTLVKDKGWITLMTASALLASSIRAHYHIENDNIKFIRVRIIHTQRILISFQFTPLQKLFRNYSLSQSTCSMVCILVVWQALVQSIKLKFILRTFPIKLNLFTSVAKLGI